MTKGKFREMRKKNKTNKKHDNVHIVIHSLLHLYIKRQCKDHASNDC